MIQDQEEQRRLEFRKNRDRVDDIRFLVEQAERFPNIADELTHEAAFRILLCDSFWIELQCLVPVYRLWQLTASGHSVDSKKWQRTQRLALRAIDGEPPPKCGD